MALISRTRPTDDDAAAKAIADAIDASEDVLYDRQQGLLALRRRRHRMLEHEADRLGQKYGSSHPAVEQARARRDANEAAAKLAAEGLERSSLVVPERDDKAWIVHGRVIDPDGEPLEGLLAVLVDAKSDPVKGVDPVRTGRNGAFRLRLPLGTAAAKRKATAAKSAARGRRGVHLVVTDAGMRALAEDDRDFDPRPGEVDYHEVLVGHDAGLK